MDERACCCMEELKSRKNAIWQEEFEAGGPIVSSSPIDQDKSIAKATNRKAITKGDVYVNSVQEVVAGAIKEFASFGFWDSRKLTKWGRELPTIDPFAITTHIQNMFVVTELAVSHDVIEFLSRLVCLGVRSISRVAWIGAAPQNFPPHNQKTHGSSTYTITKKSERIKPHLAPPPQIANFPFQCIERKFTLRSIICDINVAHSQL